MGSWGVGSFENDDAHDWLYELISGDNLNPVFTAFTEVRKVGNSYLNAQKSYEALAAAEVIAALRGYPCTNLPDELATWLEAHPFKASDDLAREAMAVVVRILRASELKDGRENMGNIPMEWYWMMGDLMSRLR